MTCPACGEAIPFAKVFFALNPIFTRCPTCRARLRGNATMMAIGAAACLLALALAVAGVYAIQRNVPQGAPRYVAFGLFALLVGVLLGFPMTKLAMRFGRYARRDRAPEGVDDAPPERGQARLVVLVGVACLLAGTVLGFVLAEHRALAPAGISVRGASDAGAEAVVEGQGGGTGRPPIVLEGRPRAAEADRRETPGRARGGATESGVGGAVAFLEVTALGPDGTRPYGHAFALLDGEPPPDRDWYDDLSGEMTQEAPARIGLPQAGRYDVVVRTQNPTGLARRRDVRVRAGETVRVVIEMPKVLPVRVENGGHWPASAELLAEGRPVLGLSTPWDGDVPYTAARCVVPLRSGPWETDPLPPGVHFHCRVGVDRPALEPGEKYVPDTTRTFWRVEVEEREVQAGGTVHLRAVQAARVAFRCVPVEGRAWPSGGTGFRVILEHAGGRSEDRIRWWPARAARSGTRYLAGTPGVARLRWEGDGILPGVLEDVRLPHGAGEPLELPIRLDPAAWPAPEPLVLLIEGAAGGTIGNVDTDLYVEALLPSEDGEVERLDAVESPAAEVTLDFGWRGATHLAVRQGTFRVSDALAPPDRGDLAVGLRRGGRVVVVPEREGARWGLGRLVVARVDEKPFFAAEPTADPVLVRSFRVEAGTVLGPLPPGRVAFEVRLNGRRLPPASVTVEAGKLVPLVLRW